MYQIVAFCWKYPWYFLHSINLVSPLNFKDVYYRKTQRSHQLCPKQNIWRIFSTKVCQEMFEPYSEFFRLRFDYLLYLCHSNIVRKVSRSKFWIFKEKFKTVEQKAIPKRILKWDWLPRDQRHSKFHKIIIDISTLKVPSLCWLVGTLWRIKVRVLQNFEDSCIETFIQIHSFDDAKIFKIL